MIKPIVLVCTRTNISKAVKWSTSRYNVHSKAEIVKEILSLFKQRNELDTERVYTTGNFSSGNGGRGVGLTGGWSYKLVIRNGSARLTDQREGVTYFLKEERRSGPNEK